jgi:hypothetical protein
MAADLYLDQNAFDTAKRDLSRYIGSDGLEGLVIKIKASFEQLRIDWDSDAGKKFFEKFENDLINNLNRYDIVFRHINENLSTASGKYEEVFKLAEAVAKSQY